MKFSDEELSRIITAHELGGLQKFGKCYIPGYPACIIQVALEINTIWLHPDVIISPYHEKLTYIFDQEYKNSWTTEEFIEWLIKQGAV